jgi:hypothetical protein
MRITGTIQMPTLSELESVLARMRPFFVVLGTTDSKLFVMYRRVSGYAQLDRVRLVASMMRHREREVVERELREGFGLGQEAAAAAYDLYVNPATANDDGVKTQRFISIILRRDTVPILTLTPVARIGFDVHVQNVSHLQQAARIAWLLRAALAMAPTRGKPSKSLSWVDAATQEEDGTAQVAVRPKPPADPQDPQDIQDIQDIDELFQEALGSDDGLYKGDDEMDDVEAIDATGNAIDAIDAIDDSKVELASADADDVDETVPRAFLIHTLHRADPKLFRFPGSQYSTDCGHAQNRQPIVVSPEELKRIDSAFPGSHTGAVQYGSTPETQARNRYICPKVWCPLSRISLSEEQFKANKMKCPFPDVDEEPILFDGYFKGRERHVGFLSSGKHPGGLCLPC